MMVYQTTFYPNASTLSQAMNVTIAAGEERSAVDLQLKLSPAFTVSGSVQGPDGPMANMPLRLQPGGLDELVVEGRLGYGLDGLGCVRAVHVPRRAHGPVHAPRAPRAARPATACLRPRRRLLVPVAGAVPPRHVACRPCRPIRHSGRECQSRSAMRTFMALRCCSASACACADASILSARAPRPTAERVQQLTVNLNVADGRPMNFNAPPARLNADGTFTTMSYPPGKYYLSVGSPGTPWWMRSIVVGGRESIDAPIDLQSDLSNAVVTFTDQTNEITGTVQQTNPAEAPARIIMVPVDYQRSLDEGVLPRRMRQTSAGESGQFTFRNLLPGDYLVTAVGADIGNLAEDAETLSSIARAGTRVSVTDGGKQSISLTVKVIR